MEPSNTPESQKFEILTDLPPARHAGDLRRVIDQASAFFSSVTLPSYPFDNTNRVSLDQPSLDARNLYKQCMKLGLEGIIVEQPPRWLNTRHNGEVFRTCFGSLITYLSRLGIPTSMHQTTIDKTFTPRECSTNKILLSFHSADKDEHEIPNDTNIWRIKESIFPPFFTFDRSGFSGWGELSRNESLFLTSQTLDENSSYDYFSALRTYITQHGISKYTQSADRQELPKDYVFHAMQISSDSVIQLARVKPDLLLKGLVERAHEFAIPLVIKRHPLCKERSTLELLESLKEDPMVLIVDQDINHLIAGAQAIVVVNSGVGMEALLRGKPVFTTGACDYRWGTHEVNEDMEALNLAFNSPRTKLDPTGLAQLVTFYFRDYCMNPYDERSIEEHVCKALLSWLRAKRDFNEKMETCSDR